MRQSKILFLIFLGFKRVRLGNFFLFFESTPIPKLRLSQWHHKLKMDFVRREKIHCLRLTERCRSTVIVSKFSQNGHID